MVDHHTVLVSVSKSSFKQEEDNDGVTEFIELADRSHATTIDDNWEAERAVKLVERFV